MKRVKQCKNSLLQNNKKVGHENSSIHENCNLHKKKQIDENTSSKTPKSHHAKSYRKYPSEVVIIFSWVSVLACPVWVKANAISMVSSKEQTSSYIIKTKASISKYTMLNLKHAYKTLFFCWDILVTCLNLFKNFLSSFAFRNFFTELTKFFSVIKKILIKKTI